MHCSGATLRWNVGSPTCVWCLNCLLYQKFQCKLIHICCLASSRVVPEKPGDSCMYGWSIVYFQAAALRSGEKAVSTKLDARSKTLWCCADCMACRARASQHRDEVPLKARNAITDYLVHCSHSQPIGHENTYLDLASGSKEFLSKRWNRTLYTRLLHQGASFFCVE